MNVGHPTYARPTVQETICEIAIDPGPSPIFSITRPGELFKALVDRYPEFETPSAPAILQAFGGQMPGMMAPFIRFSNPESHRQIIVGERFFRVHQLPAYPGWPALLAEVMSIWTTFASIASPQSVSRVSVRYLNVIPRTTKHPLPGNWLKPTRSISEIALQSTGQKPFLSRAEAWVNDSDLLMVAVGQHQQMGAGLTPIVLDISYGNNAVHQPDSSAIKQEFDRLHEVVWTEFQAAKSDLLQSYLDGSHHE